MRQLRERALGLYLICALPAFGHAASDFYREARLDGRTAEDAALISGVAGIGGAVAWPLYASAKVWGMRG